MREVDPETQIGIIGAVAAAIVLIVQWWRWVPYRPIPDPWPADTDKSVRSPDAEPVCINCLFPQSGHHWICPHCGFPSGEHVTVMPYLHIFAVGEFLRRGVTGPPDRSVVRFVGFALFAVIQYSIFAPVYWFWMVRKASGRPIVDARRPVIEFEQSE